MKKTRREKLEEIFYANASPEERLAYDLKKAQRKMSQLENLPVEEVEKKVEIIKEVPNPITGEEIVLKINDLELTEPKKIDFAHIRGFPWHKVNKETGGGDVGFMGYGAYDINLKAITLGQITSNQNNYATGLGSWFRISSDAARSITGFENGTDGRGFLITNVGSFAITLKHQDASSQAINRILSESGSDIVLAANDTAWLLYDVTTERWRAILHSVGGGGTVGPGTINEIAYFDSANTVASLTTATYPSLTELSYVKGLTSAIQTQLDAKLDDSQATAFGLSLLDDANAAAGRTTLGVVIGTNVQAWDVQLDDIAALAVTDGNFIVGNGANWVAESGATARTSLGLGTAAVVNTDLSDLNEATIEAAIDTLANLTSIQGRTVTLADAGANAIFGWDDTASAYENLTQGEASAIIDHDATANFVANEHIDHTAVTLTAGSGLTGGGDISANRTFTVGAGTGITVNTDDVAVNQATAFAWTVAHTHTVAGLVKTLTNNTDSASVQVAILQGDRATMADNDEAYLSLQLSDDGGTQKEVARLTWVATDVNAGTSVDGQIDFGVMTAGTLADEMRLDGTSLSPSANDGLQLGTTALGWADLHLATGGVINWANGEITVTGATDTITIAGATLMTGGTSLAVALGTIELGHASDTTLSRASAGAVSVEGIPVLLAGSTTVGQIPRITGSNTYAWGALNLADTDAVTGLLPIANIAAFTKTINLMQHVMLDATGDAFFEPYTILATNDSFGHAILRCGANNAAAPTVKAGFYGAIHIPEDYNTSGTVTIEVYWTSTLTSGDVVFDFDYRSIGGNDTESLDQSGYTESLTVTDTAPSATNERMLATMTVTASNLAAGDTLEFFFGRDGAVAGDTLAGSVLVHEIIFKYTT